MQKGKYTRLVQYMLLLGVLHCSMYPSYAELKIEITYVPLEELDENSKQMLEGTDPVTIFAMQTPEVLTSQPFEKYSLAINQLLQQEQPAQEQFAVQFTLKPDKQKQFVELLKKKKIIIQSEVEEVIFAQLTAKQLKDRQISQHDALLLVELQQEMQQPDDPQILVDDLQHSIEQPNLIEQPINQAHPQEHSQTAAISPVRQTIVVSPTDMTLSMLDVLTERHPKDNIVISPQSLAETGIALLMASQQPNKLKRPKWFSPQVQASSNHQIATEQPVFQSWNSLWYADQYSINPDFNQDYQQFLQGSVQPINPQQLEQNVDRINQDIAQKTNNRIQQFMSKDELIGAEAILSNVAYFKADWLLPFAAHKTTPQPFKNADKQTVKVEMMTEQLDLVYANVKDWVLLDLPFKDQHTTLTLILPPEKKPLELPNYKRLQQLDKQKQSQKVLVRLPKVKLMGDKVQMNEILPKFSSWKLDRLVNETPISNLKGIHQATIEWDEMGAEAAAATVVTGKRSLGSRADVQAFFDRPFVFLIRQGDHVLFTGAVRQLQGQTEP